LKILVTGSGGFVGGDIGRAAARAGHEVLGVGRASQPEAGWPGLYAQADVTASDLSELFDAFRPEVVMHAAGTASVAASFKSPPDDLRASVSTLANVLDAVRRSGTRPLVVFPSSAAVYGEPQQLPIAEDEPARPISPYGFHKAACELLAREYAECFGMKVLVCRLFSLFGERQRRLLVWELYRRLKAPDPVAWLEGTGEETRDYLHVEDAAAAVLALSENLVGSDGLTTVNVAAGVETRVLELAQNVRALVAPGKEVRCRGAARTGDPARWQADIETLRALAPAWKPRTLTERLAQCISAWEGEDTPAATVL
jgi:UDP-glucose 4-epimerase